MSITRNQCVNDISKDSNLCFKTPQILYIVWKITQKHVQCRNTPNNHSWDVWSPLMYLFSETKLFSLLSCVTWKNSVRRLVYGHNEALTNSAFSCFVLDKFFLPQRQIIVNNGFDSFYISSWRILWHQVLFLKHSKLRTFGYKIVNFFLLFVVVILCSQSRSGDLHMILILLHLF